MSALSNAMTLLDISEDDTSQDEKLEVLASYAEARLLSYLNPGTEEVPEELEYIVTELIVARFNRIGNEGMSSFGQDGEDITYTDNDMEPYLNDIEAWNSAQDSTTAKGKVRFI